jgi:hypothetical protein
MIHKTELHNIPELIKQDRKIVKHLLYDVGKVFTPKDIKVRLKRLRVAKNRQSKANEKYLEQAFKNYKGEDDG